MKPPVGSIVHLTSVMINAQVKAQTTMPDTPDCYSADLAVMDDHGTLDVSQLAGQPGRDGEVTFAFRMMEPNKRYKSVADLPNDLTDSDDDVGKYWVIPVYDAEGVIVEQHAWVWFGHARGYRKILMGVVGPPGPVPKVRASTDLVDLRVLPDAKSFVDVTGSVLAPSWRFKLTVPVGRPGPARKLAEMPDFVPQATPKVGSVVMFDGTRGDAEPVQGKPMWRPANIQALIPRVFSIPESAFADHSGSFQNMAAGSRMTVGTFKVPAQPFDWTPVVWGHTTTGTVFNPFKVGLEVRIEKAMEGTLIARGFGNPRGEVSVFPHYSSGQEKYANVSPTNDYAVVDANKECNLFFNLRVEGLFGMYDFRATNAQLLVMVAPINAFNSYTPPTTRRIR